MTITPTPPSTAYLDRTAILLLTPWRQGVGLQSRPFRGARPDGEWHPLGRLEDHQAGVGGEGRSKNLINIKAIQFIIIITAPYLSAGCMLFMMPDYYKATEIITLDIGREQTEVKTLNLPQGNASLMFVPQDRDCNKALNAVVEITVQSTIRLIEQYEADLSRLTWPETAAGCEPFGYFYVVSNDEDASIPLSFAIGYEDNPVKVMLKVKQADNSGRQVSVWVIYNDRVPGRRMLGKAQQGGLGASRNPPFGATDRQHGLGNIGANAEVNRQRCCPVERFISVIAKPFSQCLPRPAHRQSGQNPSHCG